MHIETPNQRIQFNEDAMRKMLIEAVERETGREVQDVSFKGKPDAVVYLKHEEEPK